MSVVMSDLSEKNVTHAEQLEAVDSNDGERGTQPVDQDDVESIAWKFTLGKFLAISSLLFGYLSAVFAIQMVSATLTTINADIGPSVAFAWLSTAQIIPVGVFSPMVGRLGDIFGRRNFILFGNCCGVIGCAMGATAQNMNVAIGGGVFIGIASTCQQLAWAGLAEMVPKRHRGLALGLFELGCAPPGAFGPIMGNAISAYSSWRVCYWVPFGLSALGLVTVFLFYRPKNQYIHEEGKTWIQQLGDMDWIGFSLYSVGLLLFLLGISFGGSELSWRSAGPIVMIVLGLVLLIVFGFFEAYYPQVFPLFPAVVLGKIREVTLVLIGTALYGMLFYSTAVLWPQQVEALYTTDLIHVGWYASILGMVGICSSVLFGYLVTAGYARSTFIFIVVLATLTSGLMALVSPTSKIYSSVFVGLMGLSVGGGMIVATAMCQIAVAHEYLGIVSALAITARNVGGAVGQTIYVAIFTQKLTAYVTPYVAVPLAEAGVPLKSLPHVIGALFGRIPANALAGLTPAQLEIGLNGVKEAFSHSLRIVYLSSIPFGVLATVAVCFCKVKDSNMTNKIDIQLDEGAKIHGITDTGKGHIITKEEIEELTHHHH